MSFETLKISELRQIAEDFAVEVDGLKTKAGFIHVPLMDEQPKKEGAFSMPLDMILEAVIDSIKASIE